MIDTTRRYYYGDARYSGSEKVVKMLIPFRNVSFVSQINDKPGVMITMKGLSVIVIENEESTKWFIDEYQEYLLR